MKSDQLVGCEQDNAKERGKSVGGGGVGVGQK